MDIAQLMCRAIVPFEYGITTEEKIDVGLKIIHPLLKKVHDDLLWWLKPNSVLNGLKSADGGREWDKTGLDQKKIGSRVRSHWRHVRSRLYFTSASHMYTLLNTLKLGVD